MESRENRVVSDEKILVLVRAQSDFKRLIAYGHLLANAAEAELHVLYVQQSADVFSGTTSLEVLQKLVNYATKSGACIHVHCQEEVPAFIGAFTRKEGFGTVVLGDCAKEVQTKRNTQGVQIYMKERILASLPEDTKVHLVSKQEDSWLICLRYEILKWLCHPRRMIGMGEYEPAFSETT